jgi:heme/copper-type cytochrome/quinol oxidase subunit 2
LSHTPSRPPSVGRRGRSRLALALLPAALLATGCSGVGGRDLYENSFSLGFPEPVTDRADDIYELWLGSVAAAAVVGFAVTFLILFAAIRYRRVSDKLPRQVRYNLPIEVLYTVVPFVIIAVLFYYTTITQNVVNDLTPEEEGGSEVNIGVIGFQWNWTFNYVDDDVSVTGIPVSRRSWCCRPTRRSASPRPRRTSSTPSGCRRSCSSATSSPVASTPSRSPSRRRGSTSVAAPSCAARSTRR